MASKNNVNITHSFHDLLPFEGALALASVISKLELRPRKVSYQVKTPFGVADIPFKNIPIQFRNGEKFEIPWGQYDLEEGDIRCAVDSDDDMPCFQMMGFEFTDQNLWTKIIDMVKQEKVTLYKGRALRMKFSPFGDVSVPEELVLSNKPTLIFNPEVEEALETSLYLPIENSEKCREMRIPLKRGVLLEAPYGMGKSATANLLAHKALANGFTFILVPDADKVSQAFKFAKKLAPAVVFVEDIDEFLKQDREDINELLNTLDGVDSKDSEIISIFSTNYVDTIDPAMLRPGRVDALISLDAPNAGTVQKIINLYTGTVVDAPKASSHLAGASPALVRECVERAKLLAMKRNTSVNDDLLLECANLLDRQRKLTAQSKNQKDKSFEHVFSSIVQKAAWKGGYLGYSQGEPHGGD